MEVLIPWLPRLGSATLLTLGLFLLIALLSGTTGLTMALLEQSGGKTSRKVLKWTFTLFSGFFRGIPELVVLFACFLGLAQVGLELGPIQSAVLGFWLVGAAYDYQVFRGALNSVPRGQYEAGRALGLSPWQVLRFVVIPQMFRIALGPWATYATGALKRMSIASAVSVSEIMYVTKQGIAATGKPFEFIFLALVLLAGICSMLLAIEVLVSRHMNFARRVAAAPVIA